MATSEERAITDITFTVEGYHGLDDPLIEDYLDEVHDVLAAKLHGDVLLSSQGSNDNGETWRTVVAERDALRAQVEAVRALADGPDHHMVLSAGPERSEVRMDGSSPYGLRYTGDPGAFAFVYQTPDRADLLRKSLAAQPHVSVAHLRAALAPTTASKQKAI